MQEKVKKLIKELCDKKKHTKKDVEKLKSYIIKFGQELFGVTEDFYKENNHWAAASYNSKPKTPEERVKVANYLAMCNLLMVINNYEKF